MATRIVGSTSNAVGPARPGLTGLLRAAMAFLLKANRRHREYLHVQELDDRMLKDVGLTRYDIATGGRRD